MRRTSLGKSLMPYINFYCDSTAYGDTVPFSATSAEIYWNYEYWNSTSHNGLPLNTHGSSSTTVTFEENESPYDRSIMGFIVWNGKNISYQLTQEGRNYYQEYLTFMPLEDSTFRFSGNSLSYSLNSGVTWVTLPANTDTPTIPSGSTIMWKGSHETLNPPTAADGIGGFVSSGNFKAYGNLMTLIQGEDAFEDYIDYMPDYLFVGLFKNCNKLVKASGLAFPWLTSAYMCKEMFYGCTSLVEAPTLPFETMEEGTCQGMFQGCISLNTDFIIDDSISNVLLAPYCFERMFQGCTSLEGPVAIYTRVMEEGSCKNMYSDCTNLTNNLWVSNIILAKDCYNGMFSGCTSLVYAPHIDATQLEEGCYANMFKGCTSLTNVPELNAKTLVNGCYSGMFSGCTSLNAITCKASGSTVELTACTTNWVSNVAASGTFTKMEETNFPIDSVHGIPNGWTVVNLNYKKQYLTFVAQEDSMQCSFSYDIDYSLDSGQTWVKLYSYNNSPSINRGQKIMWKGELIPNVSDGIGSFSCSGYFDVEGNAMSLLYGDNFSGQTSLNGKNYAFRRLFNNCRVVYASDLVLPATTLASNCYNGMFSGCTSLTVAPELPATTLASVCYSNMFSGCTQLKIAPQLPATTLETNCYYGMFNGCTSLTTAPELPATTLASGCYQYMFSGCTQLKIAPQLPATTLETSCYYSMFNGCTSLTTVPSNMLQATTMEYLCYASMFANCRSLTVAPQLPATTLAESCYLGMFYGCGNLTTAPELLATTMERQCYSNMFANCTSLTVAPQLPATTLAQYCYEGMFSGCTQLTTAPSSIGNSNTTVIQYACSKMFVNCRSLTVAPQLPAAAIEMYCYEYMFSGCTMLTTAPSVLPAMQLSQYCYQYMFYGCNNLQRAPILPAKTLVTRCYENMFCNCRSLNYINARFTTTPSTSYTYNWVYGVANSGTFVKGSDATWTNTGVHAVPTSWVIIKEQNQYVDVDPTVSYYCYKGDKYSEKQKQVSLDGGSTWTNSIPSEYIINTLYESGSADCPIDTPNERYLTFIALGDGTFKFSGNTILYSTDFGLNWKSISSNSPITVTSGQVVMWKGSLTPSSSYGVGVFVSSTNFNVEGNVMSLLYNDNFSGQTSLSGKDYAFKCLFSGCTRLIDASEMVLPATTLAYSCYSIMFRGCTSLTEAPVLSATTLASNCYESMFQGCSGLTVAPQLPATILGYSCYYNMFNGCSSLTVAPQLPATTLANYCYNNMFANCTSLTTPPSSIGDSSTTMATSACTSMFSGCTSLTVAPQLPVMTLTNSCYEYMFYGCSSLTTAPILPATTLTYGCYSNMFQRCTSLTTVPSDMLPATTLAYRCYSNMFSNCSSLTEAPQLPATTLDNYCYLGMFSGCTSLTVAPSVLPATTLAESCYSSMFYGCSGLTVAPQLLATTLAYGCCSNMFSSCSSLTTAPQLPATTLANSCYSSMFSYCTSLTVAPSVLPATTLAESCYSSMFYGCSGLTVAPQLPATTLVSRCYADMFSSCTSLTVAPELPATTLASNCYRYMFQGCTSLNKIDAQFLTTPSTAYTQNWVDNVANSGTFIKNPLATWNTETNRGVNGVPTNWVVKKTDSDTCTPSTENYISDISYRDTVNCITSQIQISFAYCTDTIGSDCTISTESINDYVTVEIGTNSSLEPRTVSGTVTYSGASFDYFVTQSGYVDYSKEYFTLIPRTSSMSFKHSNVGSVSYSIYNGTNWDSWYTLSTSSTVYVSSGQKIRFKSTLTPNSSNGIGSFSGSSQFDVEGNVMSLLYGDNFSGQTSLSGKDYAFYRLFSGNGVVDASALILPATTLVQYCYYYMFYNCYSLTTAPQLPATTLAQYCYYCMFYNCTSLTIAPQLPATTLAIYCYYDMFYNCTSLTVAPQLPATTLANYCYQYMFYNCTSLTIAPQLPATTLAIDCYNGMFHNCYSLTTASQLPATTLAAYCYDSMFRSCSGLTEAPQLPATTLKSGCYQEMFYACTSLEVAPQLPATTLVTNCYSNMFNGCTSLNKIDAQFLTTPITAYTQNWVANVANSGTFIKNSGATWDVVGVNGIPTNWVIKVADSDTCTESASCSVSNISYPTTVRCNVSSISINFTYSSTVIGSDCTLTKVTGNDSVIAEIGTNSSSDSRTVTGTVTYSGATIEYSVNQGGYVDYANEYLTLVPRSAATTFKFSGNSINYSLDSGSTWTSLASNTATPSVGVGNKIMFKASGLTPSSSYGTSYGIGKFSGSSSFDVEGNVMSLIYDDDFSGQTNLRNSSAFTYLFSGSSVVDASALILPADTLSDYCYWGMFAYCTRLTTAPTVLPAKRVGNNSCYCMFSGCTSLTVAPELPATTLASGCYAGMFSGCTSLTVAPSVLPATTLAQSCYYQMFYDCTSLTTAPELPALRLEGSCYKYMFANCNKLNYINAQFLTNPHTAYTYGWVSNVAPSGTFIKGVLATWDSESYVCNDGIPNGWVVKTINSDVCSESTYCYIYDKSYINEVACFVSSITISFNYTFVTVGNDCSTTATIPSSGDSITINIGTNSSSSPRTVTGTVTYSGATIEYSVNQGGYVDYANEYLTLIPRNAATTFKFSGNSINYSLDSGETWTPLASNTATPSVDVGEKIMFKASGLTTSSSYGIGRFSGSSQFDVEGNAMSLMYGDDFSGQTSLSGKSYAFKYLFSGSSVVDASALILPATTLTHNCYSYMFSQCYSLTTAPQLPATTLTDYCYGYMFSGCTKLTSAPSSIGDSSTTMMGSACAFMFYSCTSLKVAPQLPAMTLRSHCYNYMFSGCRSLTTAPKLPATTLASACYDSMFQNCTNLMVAPELPATTLASYCYQSMFNGCRNLTAAPVLPATTLALSAYTQMFYYCTSLNYINAQFLTIPSKEYTYGWVENVAGSGTFIKNSGATWDVRGNNGVPTNWIAKLDDNDTCTATTEVVIVNVSYYNEVKCFVSSITIDFDCGLRTVADDCNVDYSSVEHKSVVVNIGTNSSSSPRTVTGTVTYSGATIEYSINQGGYVDYANEYFTFIPRDAATTFKFSSYTTSNSVSYSLDSGSTWTSLANDTDSPSVGVGEKIMFKASGLTPSSSNGIGRFSGSSAFDVEGNAMSLLYSDEFATKTSFRSYYFKYLFNCCTTLIDASALVLPATTLEEYCYQYMFSGCTSLTVAPELPATTLANYCYQYMFYGCTSLKVAPELPATTLANSCYYYMFGECSSLRTAPELPATTLASYCYADMFQYCTSLTTTRVLSATTLVSNCYYRMFSGCRNLTTVSSNMLPATTLASSCYYGMFSGCTNLTVAPELPATTLESRCYDSMFYGCSGLTTAPELPATTLVSSCYEEMFYDCAKLNYVDAQFLTNPSGGSYTSSWLRNVSSSGTFIKNSGATWDVRSWNGVPTDWIVKMGYGGCTTSSSCTISNVSYITDVNYYVSSVVINFTYSSTSISDDCTLENESINDSVVVNIGTNSSSDPRVVSGTVTYSGATIEYSVNQGGYVDYSIYANKYLTLVPRDVATTFKFSSYTTSNSVSYSLDSGSTWTSLANDTDSPSVGVGEKIMFKASGLTTSSSYGIGRFSGSSQFDVEGNVMSLLYGDDFSGQTSLSGISYIFNSLFKGSSVVDASALVLPATTLTNNCYEYMFSGCTSLTTPPLVIGTSSTIMAYYACHYMFYNCSGLTTVYSDMLPAMTLSHGCYYGIFCGCRSLTVAPQLPATTLATNCYEQMFDSCRSLTVAPQLPATTLANYCYQSMFYGCSSLTVAPQLPATTLATNCYESMFSNCYSLTTMPVLSATTLATSCYDQMFYRCSGLTTVYQLPATTLARGCYYEMFGECSSLRTVPSNMLPARTMAASAYSYMFSNCYSLTTAPELPATTLGQYCYRFMFNSCHRLRTAPELPATTLQYECYDRMFYNCGLNYIKAMFTTTPNNDSTGQWLYNVSSIGTFVKNANATWNTEVIRGDSGVPYGWTVETATP